MVSWPGGPGLSDSRCIDFVDAAVHTMRAAADHMRESPTASGQMLLNLDLHLGPTHEIVVLGAEEAVKLVLSDLQQHYLPRRVLASRRDDGRDYQSEALAGLFAGKQSEDGKPTVFVCENFACREPIVGREAARETWDRVSQTTD